MLQPFDMFKCMDQAVHDKVYQYLIYRSGFTVKFELSGAIDDNLMLGFFQIGSK